MSTQITSTADASVTKCVTFAGSPLVKWYAYVRSGSIYLRREEAGVIGPETLVLNGNVEDFDFIVDPADANQAWIYYLCDGELQRFGVNSSPIGEAPTQQDCILSGFTGAWLEPMVL